MAANPAQLVAQQQKFQQDQIQGILDLFSGGTDSAGNPNGGGFLALLNQGSQQSLEQARQQAIADTEGLTSASLRDFNNDLLPQITGAAEDAGASGGALTALLAQNTAAAQAGQVAKLQGAQILGQEELAKAANISQQESVMSFLSNLVTQSMQGARQVGSSSPQVRGGSSSPSYISSVVANQSKGGGRTVFTGSSPAATTSTAKPKSTAQNLSTHIVNARFYKG